MEMARARSLEKPLKLMLYSSSNFSPSLSKITPRSFKTLAPSSLSSPARVLSLFSSFLRPADTLRLPLGLLGGPNLRPLSFAFPGQELDRKEDQQQQSQDYHQQLASCSEADSYQEQDHLIEVQQEKQSRFIPVKAFFLCTSIDLRNLQAQNAFNVIPPNSRATNYVVLRYYDVKGDQQVDGMVAEFTDINRGMEKTGTFTMKRKKLFQLVGKANSNLADVILKLGLFERSDIAWKNANYAQIWEYLRDEYELTQRFGSLDFKLKFVEHNIRFLQEILQNRKSDFLEWLIIILISVEILISVFNIFRESSITSL